MNRLQNLATIIAILGISILACAPKSGLEVVCFNGSGIKTPLDQSSPENAIENMALAHQFRDIELYTRQLDPSFAVRFSRPIGSDEFGWIEEFTYEQDLFSTKQLFETSSSIEYAMEYERSVPSTIEGFPASDGYRQIKVLGVNIRVFVAGTDHSFSVSNEKTLYVLKDVSSTEHPEWRVVLQQLYSPGGEPPEDDK